MVYYYYYRGLLFLCFDKGKKYSLIIFIILLIIILFLSFKTLTLNEMTCLMRKWKVCCRTSSPQTDLIIKHTPERGGLGTLGASVSIVTNGQLGVVWLRQAETRKDHSL